MRISGFATVNVGDQLFVGLYSGSNGEFVQSSGTVTASNVWIAALAGAAGRYELRGGTLDASAGHIVLGGGNGSFSFTGGELKVGIFAGDLTNDGGVLEPHDSIDRTTHINGSYTQSDTGSIGIEIGGGTADNIMDKVKITGAADLDGRLLISLANGFIPAAGDSFVVLEAGILTGQFDNAKPGTRVFVPYLSPPQIGGLGTFTVHYGPNSPFDPNFVVLTGFDTTPVLWGDYNDDNRVDAADYVVWRKAEGTITTLPNDLYGGLFGDAIGEAQYYQWRTNFGAVRDAANGLSVSVPETSSVALAGICTVMALSFTSFYRVGRLI